MTPGGLFRNQLFVEHVSRVARYAADKYGVQPIIWDDMLRGVQQRLIN